MPFLSSIFQRKPSANGTDLPKVDKRLIPNVLDELAIHRPEGILAWLPKSDKPSNGFRSITYKHFANVVNYAATWLEESMGPGEKGRVIGYIGPSDLRYVILTIAAVKVDCKVGCSFIDSTSLVIDHRLDALPLTKE